MYFVQECFGILLMVNSASAFRTFFSFTALFILLVANGASAAFLMAGTLIISEPDYAHGSSRHMLWKICLELNESGLGELYRDSGTGIMQGNGSQYGKYLLVEICVHALVCQCAYIHIVAE